MHKCVLIPMMHNAMFIFIFYDIVYLISLREKLTLSSIDTVFEDEYYFLQVKKPIKTVDVQFGEGLSKSIYL